MQINLHRGIYDFCSKKIIERSLVKGPQRRDVCNNQYEGESIDPKEKIGDRLCSSCNRYGTLLCPRRKGFIAH